MKTLMFTCYTAVILFGDLPVVDRIVKNLQPAFQVHNPTHRKEESGRVSISFLLSSSGLDSKKAKEMVSEDWVKQVVGVANQGTNTSKTSIRTDYLGCSNQNLVP